jgi:tRNA (cytosine38-C5)-methyltransferase
MTITESSLQTTIVYDEFLATQKAGDINAVRILHPIRLRYFTPVELLRLFDFEERGSNQQFQWPTATLKAKYR